MSQSTKLYLSKRWELRDIIEVMENHLDLKEQTRIKKNIAKKYYIEKFKIEVAPSYDFTFWNLNFVYNNHNRQMVVFPNTDLCIGNLWELHLGYNDEALEIMTKIAEVLGGLLEENDCSDKGIKEIQGMIRETDGLPYFLKHAIIENKLKDNDDIKGLNEYIHRWCDKIRGEEDLRSNLFERSK